MKMMVINTVDPMVVLAKLRHQMCEVVARTMVGKREHELALQVWMTIEKNYPHISPLEWVELYGKGEND